MRTRLWMAVTAAVLLFGTGLRPYCAGETRQASSVTVTGSVTDAETGEAIAEFNVYVGVARSVAPGTYIDPRGTACRDGRYETKADYIEMYAGERGYAGRVMRVEALGYVPQDSPPFQPDGPRTIDFKLVKGKGPRGTVLNPDGTPAAGAIVLLGTPMRPMRVRNGDPTSNLKAVTDEAGHFEFPPVEPCTIVVSGKSGFAAVEQGRAGGDESIRLQPWGAIEGRAMKGAAGEAGQTVELYMSAGSAGFEYRLTSDAAGGFAAKLVPPGQWVIGKGDNAPMQAAKTIVVEPGKATSVQLGGEGRPVIGRLKLPGEPDTTAMLSRIEVELKREPDTSREFYKLPLEEQYALRRRALEPFTVPRYAGTGDMSGAFRVEDVPAGRYHISAAFTARTQGGGVYLDRDKEWFEVPDVPGGRSDEPLDLGEIGLTEEGARDFASVIARDDAEAAQSTAARAPAATAPADPEPRVTGRITTSDGMGAGSARVCMLAAGTGSDEAVGTAKLTKDGYGITLYGEYWNKRFDDPKSKDPHATGFFIRAAAPGYMPVDSPVFQPAKSVKVDIAFTKRRVPIGRVLKPDGTPAAGAYVEMDPWELCSGGPLTSEKAKKTNSRGQFDFTYVTRQRVFFRYIPISVPVPTNMQYPYVVVAVSRDGFGEALDRDFLAGRADITLKPWGRVTGRLTKGGTPLAGETIALQRRETGDLRVGSESRIFGGLHADYGAYEARRMSYVTKTDEDGRFAFERVPPVAVVVSHAVPDKRKAQPSIYPPDSPWGRGAAIDLTIEPGKTVDVQFGGGRTVVGRFAPPQTPYTAKNPGALVAIVRVAEKPIPADFGKLSPTERQAWKDKWRANSRVPAAPRLIYGGLSALDGSFRLYGVAPGRYSFGALALDWMDRNAWEALDPAKSCIEFEVPEGPDDAPVDVGVIDPSALKRGGFYQAEYMP